MPTLTATADALADSRGPHQSGYGVPSQALMARADRGFARFLARTTQAEAPTERDAPASNR
ncbi:hypothetical protein ACWD3K_35990 [Streptomyces sp. NPDC002778]